MKGNPIPITINLEPKEGNPGKFFPVAQNTAIGGKMYSE